MSEVAQKEKVLKGGEFIIKDQDISTVFIPEEMNEEQAMITNMVKEFISKEIAPKFDKILNKEWDVTLDIFKKMGEMGITGIHMPAEYGGMEMDANTETLAIANMGAAQSFNVSFAAHTGIGMLPILYYGTEEQKQKYLPDLIAGTKQAAYCLTEPSSGSDARSAKTKAMPTEDGKHYILNGQKMWITNAGFADVFIVFAQVNGTEFTGFIVEKGAEGLTLGAEEHKLGIEGSSTRQVFFENVKVGADAVLGEIGKGHLIAFNVLNIGRLKLGALCIGGSKELCDTSVKYANERIQFKVPISSFGAIKYKLAEQAIRIFAGESAVFRTSDMLAEKVEELKAEGISYGDAKRMSAEEYAVECSILKLAGSEALDYTADEAVQIHGGMGYSEEGYVARAYRDARINRIFEGTNEINRLLIIDMLLRRAMKGKLDLVGPAWEVQKELTKFSGMFSTTEKYGWEEKAIKDFKKLGLMVVGAAAKQQMDGEMNLQEEQEILTNAADILVDTFVAESLLFRVKKLNERTDKPVSQEVYDAMLKTFMHDANFRINKSANDAIASFTSGDLLKTFSMGVKRFTSYPLQNVKLLRRTVADALIEKNGYCL